MHFLLACGGQGLLRPDGTHVPCPLTSADLLFPIPGGAAAVDNAARLIWTGTRLISAEPGIEAAAWYNGCFLTLSGETDCLSLRDADGSLLLTVPAGVYPQDFCLLSGGYAAVGGGAEGTVHVVRLRDLVVTHTRRVPGCAQRIVSAGDALYVLCTVGDDILHTALCRLTCGGCEILHVVPGIPGAVSLLPDGALCFAVSGAVYHLSLGALRRIGSCGLIRRFLCAGNRIFAADPVSGVFEQILPHRRILFAGNVQDALLLP